jgi:hypothetical protein
MTSTWTTSAFYTAIVRYPPARKDEVMQVYRLLETGYRMNPTWSSAKQRYLTALGNQEHAAAMERIRLVGEEANAYAQQASAASDAQIRSWEASEASSDREQRQTIDAIREVETYHDPSGGEVKLDAGYEHAWSHGGGSYILSNQAGFDPSSAFQDPAWQPIQRVE